MVLRATLPLVRPGAGVAMRRAGLLAARLPAGTSAPRRAPPLRRSRAAHYTATHRTAAALQLGGGADTALAAAAQPHADSVSAPPGSVAAALAATRAALPGTDARFAGALLLSTALLLVSPVITALSMHAIQAPPGSAAAARSGACLLALAAVYAGEPLVAGAVISSWAALTQGVILRLRCATSAALLRGWNTRGGGASPKELAEKQAETLETCSANNIATGDSGPRAVLKFIGALALLFATSPRLAPLIAVIFVGAVAAISARSARGAALAAAAAAAREAAATHSAAFLLAGTNVRAYGLEAAVAASTARLGRAAMAARLAEQAHAQGTSRRAAHVITLAWCAIQVTATVLRDAGAPLSVFELQAALGFTLLLTMSTGGVLAFIRDARIAAAAAAALAAAGVPPAPEPALDVALGAALAAAAAAPGGADVALPGVLPAPLRPGRLYTLMGPSGSGKSRVMDALAGQPEGGTLGDAAATLAGVSLPARALCAPAWRARVAYMPQTATTELPPLPVWALLRAGCRQASPALVRRVAAAFGLDTLNLRAPAGAKPGADWVAALRTVRATQLSAGQRQRVALALFFVKGALYSAPCIVLLPAAARFSRALADRAAARVRSAGHEPGFGAHG